MQKCLKVLQEKRRRALGGLPRASITEDRGFQNSQVRGFRANDQDSAGINIGVSFSDGFITTKNRQQSINSKLLPRVIQLGKSNPFCPIFKNTLNSR